MYASPTTARFTLAMAGAVAILLAAACAGPGEPEQPAAQVIPDWVNWTPSEPGVAFYGVGHADVTPESSEEDALQEATQGARQQLAERLRACVQRAYMVYWHSFLLSADEFGEIDVGRTVSRGVTNQVVPEFEIVATSANRPFPDAAINRISCLAVIPFDRIDEVTCEHVRREAEREFVETPGDYSELRRLLVQAQEELHGNRPAGLHQVSRP